MCLDEAKQSGRIGLDAYSYVSLFGLNKLSDLRMSVFEGRQSLKAAASSDEGWALKKIVDKISEKAKFRSRAGLLKAIPFVGNLSEEEVIGLISLAQSPQQIVCIDDLERRGDGLTVKDILGFASFLKDERSCKVVIILNEEQLDDLGLTQMSENLEKVVDTSLTMQPTSNEAISVALKYDDAISKVVGTKCRSLGISNIRAIRRAEKLLKSVAPHLTAYGDQTQNNIASSLILFSWARDQPNEAPTIEFLKSIASSWHHIVDEDGNDAEQEQAAKWKPLLEKYGYSYTDELDLALMDSVAAGYFDMERLRPLIAQYDAGIEAEKASSSFSDAWRLFSDSFSIGEDEVCDALCSSFMENFQHISPAIVLMTFNLLKDLGREHDARELVDVYVSNRDGDREFFDLDHNHFIEGQIDPYFRSSFEKRCAELSQKLNFKEVLLSVEENWNSDTLSFLAASSEKEYYELFKMCEGDELRKLLSGATSFRRIANPSDSMTEITDKAAAALTQIGNESRINAHRVRRFGIIAEKGDGQDCCLTPKT